MGHGHLNSDGKENRNNNNSRGRSQSVGAYQSNHFGLFRHHSLSARVAVPAARCGGDIAYCRRQRRPHQRPDGPTGPHRRRRKQSRRDQGKLRKRKAENGKRKAESGKRKTESGELPKLPKMPNPPKLPNKHQP